MLHVNYQKKDNKKSIPRYIYMDHVECCVPEGHRVGPAKPQHERLCDVHALRAHHWNNVFEQGGGGRSANDLLADTERSMS